MALLRNAACNLRTLCGDAERVRRRAVSVVSFGGVCSRGLGSCRRFSSAKQGAITENVRKKHHVETERSAKIVQLDYGNLVNMEPAALSALRRAFVGSEAFGAVAVVNIPGYGDLLQLAFRAGINLSLTDPEGRKKAAAVNNTYPGWSGEPGKETHPLQSSFLFNVKEEINGVHDPYFGKNIFPTTDFKQAFVNLACPMHEAALRVLQGCDVIMEELMGKEGLRWSKDGRSLHRLAKEGPALAGRFICYDSGFTREDSLLSLKDTVNESEAALDEVRHTKDGTILEPSRHGGGSFDFESTDKSPQKYAGHAADGLASMRSHATPVKSAGHAKDGLASMRTHSTPVKSAGHAGDGLASMRTHSTPVKSAGHAGDGLASMRTHSTPVKSAGHAEDGLASMRTHSTPVKSAGHATVGHQPTSASEKNVPGDYWLPWHIDSNFVTLIHKEVYAREEDATLAEEPEGAGVFVMNKTGDVTKLDCPGDALVVQMGAFAQIYAGGHMTACRHAVRNPLPPGVARFNYCNFWYAKWDTSCTVPRGREAKAVNTGWNAMMDSSYVGISMKQGFAAFRSFMTSPEARVQLQDSARFKELSALVPLPKTELSLDKDIIVDLLTDIRCPFSYLALVNFRNTLRKMAIQDRVLMRYYPVFLNPNVAKEGECLDDYLFREYGITKEEAHSEDYPLFQAGLKVGIKLNPHRRVVNTFDAFCVIDLSELEELQDEMVEELSRRYFVRAENISEESVLQAAAKSVGLRIYNGDMGRAIKDPDVRARVWRTYQALAPSVKEVPLFVVRERVSGHGAEVVGSRTGDEWEQILGNVLKKGRLMGMSVLGYRGDSIWLAHANPTSPVSMCFNAQHNHVPEGWQYTAADFERLDESDDDLMYATPRIGVTHLDEASLFALTEVYRRLFDSFHSLAVTPSILDLCSSWTSHFPADYCNQNDGSKMHVTVHGLNAEELKQNSSATHRHVQDLNKHPRLPWGDESFDCVTNAFSVHYLTKPREVFAEIFRVLKPGGVTVIAHSHRSFIEKCTRVWSREMYDGEGHALILRNYLLGCVPSGSWAHVQSVDVSPQHGDPLWIVVAVKSFPEAI